MDIRCRIGQSKQTFMDMKNVLCPRSLGLGVRKRFFEVLYLAVLLYGCESRGQ